jgi:hypothetical protein
VGESTARGWVALPSSRAPRWYLSVTLSGEAGSQLPIYRPLSRKAFLGWRLTRTGARAGVFRVLPRTRIPDEVQEALEQLRTRGEVAALARTSHPHRWIAQIFSTDGPHSVAKITLDEAGAALLDAEHENLRYFGRLLEPPLRAPKVVHYEYGALVLEGVVSRRLMTPTIMPVPVASSLGSFFGALNRGHSPPATGLAHADFAPWNLLRDRNEWILIDWESVSRDQGPFLDLIHYQVQSYVHFGRPSLRSMLEGFAGVGSLSDSIRAYAERAGHPPSAARSHLREYVISRPLLIRRPHGRGSVKAAQRRVDRLIESVSR